MLRYGVIGFGYWGPNLVRSFVQARDSKVVAIAELDSGKRAKAAVAFPQVALTDDPNALMCRQDVDVVAIASPVSTHYALAKAALEAGKHVFVEKPFTMRACDAEELIEMADRRRLQIFVDHIYVYTGAITKIKEIIDQGGLGKVLYYDSVRVNLGLFKHDANVLWDLAVHDVAILDHIFPERPAAVSAVAVDPIGAQPASIGYLTLYYPSSAIAHVHASWLSPVKLRQILIGGDKRMVVYNDLEPSEKVRIYDRGVEFARSTEEEYRLRVGYRSGDVLAPQLDVTEALASAARHANEAILEGKPAITSGKVGYNVVKILEAADHSVHNHGQIVSLE